MADELISDLTLYPGPVTGAELLEIDNGTSSYKLPISSLPTGGGGGTGNVPWKDFVADFGADPTGVTDCGAAWDAAMAYALAHGGLSMSCVGTFLVSRALQNTSAENAQLPLPSVLCVGGTPITVQLFGINAPNPVVSVIGGQPDPGVASTLFKSTLTTGSGSMMAAYGPSGSFRNFSNLNVVMRDILFEMPDNPTNSCLNLQQVTNVDIDRVFVYTGNMTLSSVTYPTHATSFGLKTPGNGNGASTILYTVDVVGFYNSYELSEHAIGMNIKAWAAVNPFVFTNADHASAFHRMLATHCTNGIVAPASGAHVTRILQYDAEHASGGSFSNATDIKDPSNTLYGDLAWRIVDAGVGGATDFNVVGSQNFSYSSHNVIARSRNLSGASNTFAIGDENGLVNCTDTPAMTLIIPPESSVPWHVGAVLTAVVTGTGVVTITAGAGVTVQGLNGLSNKGQGDVITCRKVGINTWNIDSTPSTTALTNPMTTAGDIIYGGVAGAPTRLANGTLGYALTAGASAPVWADVRGVAQTVANANTAIAAIHRGGMITRSQADSTARTYTIPSNASTPLEVGHITTIVNDGASGNVTIAITTDTLIWSPTLATGSRVLAPGGIATIIKVSATRWYISGVGLT